MSIPNLRAIRDWCKEKIKGIEDSLVINGVRYYLDYQNGKYGVNTDPERGADTFTPFKSDEGGGGDGSGAAPEQPKEPEEAKQIIDFEYSGRIGKGSSSNFNCGFDDFDVKKLNKFILNKYYLEGSNASSAYATNWNLDLIVEVGGEIKNITLNSASINDTNNKILSNISNIEYTLDELKELAGGEIEKIYGFSIVTTRSSSTYVMLINSLQLKAEIQYTS